MDSAKLCSLVWRELATPAHSKSNAAFVCTTEIYQASQLHGGTWQLPPYKQ